MDITLKGKCKEKNKKKKRNTMVRITKVLHLNTPLLNQDSTPRLQQKELQKVITYLGRNVYLSIIKEWGVATI